MERIQNINVSRIQWCCQDHGITVDDLADQIKVRRDQFQRVMASGSGLTFRQLQGLANHFNRGVLFFVEAGPFDERRLRSPQFRTLQNQTPDLSPALKAFIERVEAHRDLYLSLREDLDPDEGPRFAPPKLPDHDWTQAAAIAREWLGLGETNAFAHYREAVEANGVLVFVSTGYPGAWRIPANSSVAGFSLYDSTCPVIVVRRQVYETRQSFTLMHELGHILLHQSSFIDDEEDLHSRVGRERAANAFAGRLLVPDAFLERIPDAGRPSDVALYDDWLRPFRREWGVSTEVILRRLLEAGRLGPTLYRAYRMWWEKQATLKQAGGGGRYRAREPLRLFGEGFVRTILDALHAQHISLNKASKYLDNIRIADVHRLEADVKGV